MDGHSRNIEPMNKAPRCGAGTRAGTACQAPAISGKTSCRMHGGKGSGAPAGNHNAWRHGAYTKDMIEREERVRDLSRWLRCVTVTLEPIKPTARSAALTPSTNEIES